MKKILSMAALMLLLASCSGADPSQSFVDIRAAYLAADVTLTAELTADYGDRSYDYTLSYTGDGKRGEVTILSPELVSGISARIDEDKTVTLECDEVIIDTGMLYGSGTSPVEALPLIVNAVREGYVSDIYTETIDGTEYIVVEADETPAGEAVKTYYTLWFSAVENSLYKAEISVDGYTVISAMFEET